MKKYYLQTQIYLLLLLFIFIAACNGQNKTGPDSLQETKDNLGGQPKIIKTQGAGLYDNIHCGLQDKDGNLWFGTTGEGIYRYDGKSFTNFTTKDGLSSNEIWCMHEDKEGNLWFGTGDGVCRYDYSASVKTGSNTQPDGKVVFTTLRMFATNFQPFNTRGNNPSAKNAVWSILQDNSDSTRNGNFWFGTSEGVFRYNGKSLTHFFYNDSVIKNSGLRLCFIQSIIEDKAGNIWFASWQREGVCRYDGKTITRLKPNDDDMVHSILEDKNGNIWFGTRNHGACRYDSATGRFTNFDDIEIFSKCCVYAMAEDKAGNIWFATELGSGGEGTIGGAWCYNPSPDSGSKPFTNFTTKDGLSHNSVFNVTVDKLGKLWFGTRGTGLCSYDGKTFINFSE